MNEGLSYIDAVQYLTQQNTLNPDALWDITKHREKRSNNANGLFWKCCEMIAQKIGTDKWSVYLDLIKRHGKHEYILVKPKALESMKKQWRECEELGEVNVNGKKAIQLLCYYGSSTYNSKQFSVLLDDAIDEMKRQGLRPPTEEHVNELIEDWAKNYG